MRRFSKKSSLKNSQIVPRKSVGKSLRKSVRKSLSKNKNMDPIDEQIKIFEYFMFNLIEMLHNFDVRLIDKTVDLKSIYLFKPFTTTSFNENIFKEKIVEHAKYIYSYNYPKLTFNIGNGIFYSFTNVSDPTHKHTISKGTAIGASIVNFYKSSLKYGNKVINTYRFGTPLKFKDRNHQINNFVNVIKKENKKIVIVSLLGACDNSDLSCKFFRSVSFLSKKLKDTLKEDEILDAELARKDIHVISFPLRASKYYGIRLLMSLKKNTSEDIHVSRMISFVNVNSGRETFEGIVKLSLYFYFNCLEDYVLGYHCKSGKERSSLFDSINKSTYYYIITTNMSQENYKEIEKSNFSMNSMKQIYSQVRKLSLNFMYYGLIIGYFSMGSVGLKLGTSDLAKYVLRHRFKEFVGYN